MVECPICSKQVQSAKINDHIDSGCQTFLIDASTSSSSSSSQIPSATQTNGAMSSSQKRPASSFFHTPSAKRQSTPIKATTPSANGVSGTLGGAKTNGGIKRSFDEGPGEDSPMQDAGARTEDVARIETGRVLKRTKTNRAAPLAERMRPQNLDEVFGQDLVGPHGVLRSLIESDRVPSMILWGASGTGKTTIARCIANMVGSRFVEMNATSSGVAECKKIFNDAANELALTGRKTIIFCDEIHRFSKSQQDVFLKPVEAGTITLIGATTENPSFKVVNALLSRCRTFTLQKLTTTDIQLVLSRALQAEVSATSSSPSPFLDEELMSYLANFADGDARTALNLLELAMSLANRDGMTKEIIKESLTKTLVYDRAGDQHYDTISAFHKSVRGSDPDAALYYLARMLQSGEDPLFIARRMVVIASEDVGLADNSLLSLATSTYTATQQIGMPEARIPLAHCAVALSLAPKSTRAYRGLNNAFAALKEPGVASLPVPIHLRNAPTRLMRELGYGREYKYNPNYKDGKVKQDYLPDTLLGRTFLEDRDLGTEIDPDLIMEDS
ncbi:P-loop containing nucleoside triphosphate hydrolase protein [Daldinia loculata]|nr:P-loop containing nucleoside triphosphate hydrolase protein [Daldinia loculata]